MSEKLQPVRGMKDLFPEQHSIHSTIINTSEFIGSLYGYRAMATPIVEHSSVFSRTLGDTSEIVNKEMYSFMDRSNDSITLRPEFTAGVMRAFISEGLHHKVPLRFFSSGPVFRYDRPQAGRQRQFHQVNFEHLGADGAFADAEILRLSQHILEALGVGHLAAIELNSLGCSQSRINYAVALKEYFAAYESELSEESKVRLIKNPMRILDSKNEHDKKLVASAPLISQFYTKEAAEYFEELLQLLEIFKVKYTINERLVRGLDYYCHTAFEFTTANLGTQTAVGGGGRYDGLCKLMGGPALPAIGFALGVERIALLQNAEALKYATPVIIIPIGDENIPHAINLANKFRDNNKYAMIEQKGKLAKRMQNADKTLAEYCILIGSDEIAQGKYKLRSMKDGAERMITETELMEL